MPPQAASPVVGRSIVSWGGLVSTMLRVYQLLSPRVDSLSYRLLRVTRCAQRLQVRFRIRAPGLTRTDMVHFAGPCATHSALREIGEMLSADLSPLFAHRPGACWALFRVSLRVLGTAPTISCFVRAGGHRTGHKRTVRHMIYSFLNHILQVIAHRPPSEPMSHTAQPTHARVKRKKPKTRILSLADLDVQMSEISEATFRSPSAQPARPQ